jgi:hypothetical protein
MERATTLCGAQHDELGCPDELIRRWKDGTYGLVIHDGGSAISVISFCPYCGTDLSNDSLPATQTP